MSNGFNGGALLDAIVTYALQLGVFTSVNKHEPINNVGTYTASVIGPSITPAHGASGLDATSVRAEFLMRIYVSTVSQPLDEVDPNIANAVSLLLNAFSGGFTFGNTVRQIDLLGAYGTPLSSKDGYVNLSGNLYRIADITIPVIVDDVWQQVA